MPHQQNASNERLTEPLLNAVWQSNKNNVSKLITESKNGKATANICEKVNNHVANTLPK